MTGSGHMLPTDHGDAETGSTAHTPPAPARRPTRAARPGRPAGSEHHVGRLGGREHRQPQHPRGVERVVQQERDQLCHGEPARVDRDRGHRRDGLAAQHRAEPQPDSAHSAYASSPITTARATSDEPSAALGRCSAARNTSVAAPSATVAIAQKPTPNAAAVTSFAPITVPAAA